MCVFKRLTPVRLSVKLSMGIKARLGILCLWEADYHLPEASCSDFRAHKGWAPCRGRACWRICVCVCCGCVGLRVRTVV